MTKHVISDVFWSCVVKSAIIHLGGIDLFLPVGVLQRFYPPWRYRLFLPVGVQQRVYPPWRYRFILTPGVTPHEVYLIQKLIQKFSGGPLKVTYEFLAELPVVAYIITQQNTQISNIDIRKIIKIHPPSPWLVPPPFATCSFVSCALIANNWIWRLVVANLWMKA